MPVPLFYTDIVYLHLPHQNQTEYFPKNIPFMMQKACFYTVKGGFSESKRWHIANYN